MLGVQLADVSTRCSSHPQGKRLEHLVETSASCTPSIKLSTKNLRCLYTATATENDVTILDTCRAVYMYTHLTMGTLYCITGILC